MPTNDFKAIAKGGAANVVTQAEFDANAALLEGGFVAGVARSDLFNKVFRQATTMAHSLAQYIADLSGADVLDTGDAVPIIANLKAAIGAQIDAQSGNFAADTGTANAKVIALNPAPAAYTDGMTVRFRNLVANTGATTLKVGALAAISLRNNVDGALVSADLPSGVVVTAVYVSALSRFNLTERVLSQIPTATESVAGKAEVATQAETDAGALDTVIVTPKKLQWGFSILRAATGYIVFPSWMGGLIIQWGSVACVENSSASVTFPIAFPTAVFNRQVSMQSAASVIGTESTDVGVVSSAAPLAGMSVWYNSSSGSTNTTTVNWLVFGY